jgi:hypothetical protein
MEDRAMVYLRTWLQTNQERADNERTGNVCDEQFSAEELARMRQLGQEFDDEIQQETSRLEAKRRL